MRPPSSDYRRIESRRARKPQTEPFHPLPGVRFQIGDHHFPAFFAGRRTVQVLGRNSVFVGGLILAGRSYFTSFFPWCGPRPNRRRLESDAYASHVSLAPSCSIGAHDHDQIATCGSSAQLQVATCNHDHDHDHMNGDSRLGLGRAGGARADSEMLTGWHRARIDASCMMYRPCHRASSSPVRARARGHRRTPRR